MDFKAYARTFEEVREDFEASVAAFGLPFEEEESSPRVARTHAACSHYDNGGASLWESWISPACIACRTGEQTATFFVSLRCTKHCYFCFNPNQEDYDYFQQHKRDIVTEIEQAHAQGARFKHLAITGGEPLLHTPDVVAFVRRAKELYPGVHVRMYTSGDLLDEGALTHLAEAGLDEVRFSVKPVETDGAQEPLFDRIEAAVAALPDVMVEMPVIPGALDEMKRLLLRLDSLGVRGINLLEFCFPLCNAEAFRERGFKLRKQPYEVLYNYWYAGGLPLAGSETEALELVRFAVNEGLRLGVHYCSLDNKNTGQMYQQNKALIEDETLCSAFPWLSFDKADYFLKCAKVFGEDAARLHQEAEEERRAMCCFEPEVPSFSFPLALATEAREAFPKMQVAVSLNVLEWNDDAPYIREVAVREFA